MFNNNNGTCGGSSEELGQALDQWGLVFRSGVRFSVCCIVLTNEKPSWSEQRAWSLIRYSFKDRNVKQTMNFQAKLVSAKRRKRNIKFGADASKTPCIAFMLIFHMEPLMESMLMLQNMPHLWCKSAISLRRWYSVEVEAFLTWFSMGTISKWKQIDRYYEIFSTSVTNTI